MKKRPLVIRLVALALILSPLWIFFQIMYLYEIPWKYWTAAFQPAIWHPQVWLVMLASMFTGYAVWTVHCWGYWTLVGFVGAVLVNNVVIWLANLSQTSLLVRVLFTLGLAGLALLSVYKEFRSPYFNPRMRWWEQARRYITGDFKVSVWDGEAKKYLLESRTFDISTRGAYLLTDHPVSPGHQLNLVIHLPQGKDLKTRGEVVWAHMEADIHQGFGVRFVDADARLVGEIKHILGELHARMKER